MGDYTPENPSGHMYSENKIIEDGKAFIDQLIEMDEEFTKFAMNSND